MERLRLVIDTNVFLVSLAAHYKLHWIFQSILNSKFDLCVTNEILKEYEEIIGSRYGLSKTDSTLDFLLLLPNVIQITPYFRWDLLADKDDNKFVDCALAGSCDFIVSNDKGFRTLASVSFPSVKVLTAEKFTLDYKEIFEA